MRRAHLSLFVLTLASLAACGGDRASGDDAETSALVEESSAPRLGSTINSPTVGSARKYFGSRRIDILQTVGVEAAILSVARRADGIIANQPANGRVGVDELAILEGADHRDTLFPEERNAIPKLWALLEVTSAPPLAAPTPSYQFRVFDDDVAKPTQLPISELGNNQQLARRIQLTQNNDGNADTISAEDVRKAYADRASYLPAEAAAMIDLVAEIAERAKDLPADARRLEVSGGSSGSMLDTPAFKVSYTTSAFIESWQPSATESGTAKVLTAANVFFERVERHVNLVRIDLESGADELTSPYSNASNSKYQHEVWLNGTRTNVFTLKDSSPAEVTTAPWGAARNESGKVAVMNFTERTTASYAILGQVQLATAAIPTGGYVIHGTSARVDVMPTGWAIVRTGGAPWTCRPKLGSQRVARCDVFDQSGAPKGSIAFGRPAGETVALGKSDVAGFAGELYPY